MFIRSAFWIGKPKVGQDDQLRSMLVDEVIPAMRLFPGVSGVKLMFPKDLEDGPPDIWCQVLVEYLSEEAMQLMMDSQQRAALRPRVIAAAQLFDGRMSHINYDVNDR